MTHVGFAGIVQPMEFDESRFVNPVTSQRTDHQVLVSIAQLLEELLAEAKRANSADRTGVVSSIAFEDMTKGEPKCSTKHYAGSPLTRGDVDAALDIHAYAHRMAAQRFMDGWKDTVDALTNGDSSK